MAVTQEVVIAAFLKRRNEILGTNYKVIIEPDKVNRKDKEVDALCESEDAQPLAIEHTQLETYQQQIRDNNWFERLVVPVEGLGQRYDPWWVGMTFLYWRGKQWGAGGRLVDRVRDWLDANLDKVPVRKTGREIFEGEIPDVGEVRVWKHRDTGRRGIHVRRTVPTNVEFPKEGVETMTRALGHKYEELVGYRKKGYISALVIDSRDISLTNHIEQYKAYLRARQADAKPELDEIWVADVFEGAKESLIDFLCFRANKMVMAAANPKDFMLGQEYDAYWNEVLTKEDKGVN